MITPNDFTRINNDVNSNPRYVCHYSDIITDNEREISYKKSDLLKGISVVDIQYDFALSRAKKIGGRKFHNKQYGGGIVFQSYNLQDTCNDINELIEQSK
ncbi:MAG TPA: hypothetical protein VIM65_15365 [Cyclobacteriaceae bacterium]